MILGIFWKILKELGSQVNFDNSMSNWLLAVSADIALPSFKIVSSIDHVEGIWWISVIYRDFWEQIEALDNELKGYRTQRDYM